MKLKAILSDFDGTLIDKNGEYNKGLRELIQKFKLHDIHFSIATGRAYYSHVDLIIRELNLSDYHIFNGGSLIFNTKESNVLFIQTISTSSTKKVIDYLIEHKINFTLETKDYAYFSSLKPFPTYAPSSRLKPLSEVTDYSNILKILIAPRLNNLSQKDLDNIKNNLDSLCKDLSLFKFFYYGKWGMDITSKKATKHTAVLEYEKLLKIPREQIVGMGDGLNDYPLFTACGYKIAMGNAPQELKEIADFIAPSIEESGTVIALEHIIKKFKL